MSDYFITLVLTYLIIIGSYAFRQWLKGNERAQFYQEKESLRKDQLAELELSAKKKKYNRDFGHLDE